MKLDESIFDEIASEPTFAPIETIGIETANSQLPETDDDRGVAHLLLNAISNTTDSISMFNDIIANTDSEGIISIINEILLDENRHLGLLQSALEVVSPNANAIDDGSSLGDDLVQNEINESIDEKFIGGPHEAHYKNYIIKRDITDSFWEIENNGGDVIADGFDSVIDAKAYLDNDDIDDINEDIHDKFKKDIKNSYKSWVNNQERIEQRRNDMLDLLGDMDDVSDETRDKWTKKTKELYPDVEYSYSFPQNIEKDDYPFYVTYYAEYPIYEPAEGGYYYAGRDAVWSEGFNSREEAEAYAKKYVDQDMDNWEQSQNGYEMPGQYIGQTQSIRIEDNKSYLSDVAEPHPYE